MPRLAGFTAAEVISRLRRAGFVFDRQAKGGHEIWWNPATLCPHDCARSPGGELSEDTVHAVIKQGGLSVDEFLDL